MKTITILLTGLFILLVGLVVWGLIEPRLILDERSETAVIPHLPEAWIGNEVAVIADLQVGMWWANTGMVESAVRSIIERKPAAVLLAGDFLYHPLEDEDEDVQEQLASPEFEKEVVEQIELVLQLLQPLLTAGLPTYAVLGNHDYAQGYESSAIHEEVANLLAAEMKRAGIVVLRNEAVVLRPPTSTNQDAGELYLGGVDAVWPKRADVDQVLAGIPSRAARIIMMHNPQAFADFPEATAPLAVAGHTHGGQLRIPGLPHWSWLEIVRPGELHTDGWTKNFGKPGNRLYINRGIGFGVVPMRINCPPEVTYFKLTSD